MLSSSRNYKIGFITSVDYPDLAEDDHLLLTTASKQWDCHCLVWEDETVDWASFDILIIRSLWDYVQKFDKFQEWMSMIEKSGVKLLNEISVIKWNFNKNYLAELESIGVEIVPSVFVKKDAAKRTLLYHVQQAVKSKKFKKSMTRFVMKPCVGAGGYGTHLFGLDDWQSKQGDFDTLLEASDMIIQPFVDTIKTEGETSFIFFNGAFSHSIIKRPSTNDFRVQEGYGGTVDWNHCPPQHEIETAKRIIEHISKKGKVLYTRIDMLRYQGRLCLGECELFEPALYFMEQQSLVNRFIQRLAEHLQPKRRRSISHASAYTATSIVFSSNGEAGKSSPPSHMGTPNKQRSGSLLSSSPMSGLFPQAPAMMAGSLPEESTLFTEKFMSSEGPLFT
eukprot:gene12211-14299_t